MITEELSKDLKQIAQAASLKIKQAPLSEREHVNALVEAEMAEIKEVLSLVKKKQNKVKRLIAKANSLTIIHNILNGLEKNGVEVNSLKSVQFHFEIGPQYNDEGYDLDITYDSFVSNVTYQNGVDVKDDLNDAFSDLKYDGYICKEDFALMCSAEIGYSLLHKIDIDISDVAALRNLPESSPLEHAFAYFTIAVSKEDSGVDFSNY